MCGSVLQPSRKPSEAKKKWDKTASGDKYRGGYDRNKKPHGQGEMKWALDGSRYKGDFVHGQRHGKGTVWGKDKSVYIGNFVRDKATGHGIIKYPCGGEYRGPVKEGRRHGEGETTEADTSEYIGNYHDDRKHGKGTLTHVDGSVYDGMWKDDRREGRGILIGRDKSWFHGMWKDGRKHGPGVEFRPDGTSIFDGVWEKGHPVRNKAAAGPNKHKDKKEGKKKAR